VKQAPSERAEREACPQHERHTYGPDGYNAWHDWAQRRSRTHTQHQCDGCGYWLIWMPKTPSSSTEEKGTAMSTRFAPAGVALPQYQPEGLCPKCGHADVGTFYSKPGCGDPECSSCDREHLRRLCHTCRYEWAEAVIDPPGGQP